jgi:1-acyl-sn-glycerol-3-phosphate acyltransferase
VRRLLQTLALYAFHISFTRPLLRWVAGVRYRRRDRVPDGPCLVVSNHNSHLDAAVLMTMFPLRRLAHVHPVAAADYFGSNWFMSTLAMLLMNGIPIERRPSRGNDPLAPLVGLLKSGESLIFFPEGSRGEAGVVARFRSGIGKLVREVPGLLVVPVFLSGPERIWPRGEMVPVPLSVDANIGRPRTYDALEDPRAIAEQVRQDVLALAPPPPPVPGEGVAPPLRVAVCGIDDGSVSDVSRRVAGRLGRYGPAFGVADRVLEADADGVRETTAPVPLGRERAWLGLLAALFRTGPRFKGRRFVDLVERAQVNEALGQGGSTRFVVEDGSVLVDLLASALAGRDPAPEEREARDLLLYLTGERKVPLGKSWRTIRTSSEVWLLNTFNLTRATVPEVLVHVTLPVAPLMRRLRSEGVELLPYQSESGLERLQEAYRESGELLRRRRRVEVVELDLSEVDAETAAERIEAVCLDVAEARSQVSTPGNQNRKAGVRPRSDPPRG